MLLKETSFCFAGRKFLYYFKKYNFFYLLLEGVSNKDLLFLTNRVARQQDGFILDFILVRRLKLIFFSAVLKNIR